MVEDSSLLSSVIAVENQTGMRQRMGEWVARCYNDRDKEECLVLWVSCERMNLLCTEQYTGTTD